MRILILAWRDLANKLAGGSEVLVDRLCTGLTERGHDVTLMCAKPVDHGHPYQVHPNGRTVDQYLRAPFAYLEGYRDADLVVDVANGVSFYTPLWRRKPTICFVNHIHTEQWDQWFPAPIAAVGRYLETHAMPAAYRNRLFVAVSPSTADNLEAMGVDRDRIRIIINGTDLPDEVGAEAPEPLFVGLGRLVPHKRFELAVEAYNQIRPAVGGRLVIAGDGPERDRLLAMAGPGVEIAGKITEEAKHDLLREAWLMVHPASHEGWGLVITEAAAYGTPSLAFRVPGLKDSIVDGMSGVLVDRPEDLAPTWQRIAQDPALRARLRIGARRRATACTWEATVDRFEEICEEAVASHRRSLHLPRGSWTGPDERVTVAQFHAEEATPADDRPELAGIPVGTGRPTLRVVRDRPDLSIVLPAFDEQARLPFSLPVLLDHLATRAGRTEVIVVDDGSTDQTVKIASELLAGVPLAGVYQLGSHAGKGAAVRAGVARATGHRIVFMDADMATDLEFLDPLLAALDDAHVAVGSRSAPGAVTSGVTPSSDATHRAFNALARRVTGLEVTDFQCGFKAFRGSSGRLLFHLLRERGYAFDVELLTLADRLGLTVAEVPVHWKAVRGSHVRIVVDSALMAYQVGRITKRTRRGQLLSAIEARGRDGGALPEDLVELVRGHLPVSAPVLDLGDGALALLPFVEPVDSTDIAVALERQLEGVSVTTTTVDTGAILEPGVNRLRSALAAS
jgi:glycosyltransferase involved in cell wall biosynthesis